MGQQAERRLNYLFFAHCWVAPLSLIGSSLTIRAIYHQYRGKKRRLTTYQRLLLGISVFDFVMSAALMLGPVPMPMYMRDYGIPGVHGNVASCTAQGFLTQLGMGSFVYSMMLMLYFVLVIRYNVTSRVLEEKVEPLMHAIAILYAVGSSVIGLPWQIYNPSGVTCWVAAVPQGCEDYDDVECTRGGDHVKIFGQWLLVYPYVGMTCLTIFCTIVIAVTVYQQHQTRLAYVFKPAPNSRNDSNNTASTLASSLQSASSLRVSNSNNNNNNSKSPQGRRQKAKLQQAVTQSILYGFWFLNFAIWSLLSFCFSLAGRELDVVGKHFWLTALALTLFPAQGIFNFVIYVRPTYLSIRQAFPEEGRWFAVREAVWHPFATIHERADHAQSSSSGVGSSKSSSRNNASSEQQPRSSTKPTFLVLSEETNNHQSKADTKQQPIGMEKPLPHNEGGECPTTVLMQPQVVHKGEQSQHTKKEVVAGVVASSDDDDNQQPSGDYNKDDDVDLVCNDMNPF